MRLETRCIPSVFSTRNAHKGTRVLFEKRKIFLSLFEQNFVHLTCTSASVGESGRKDDSLLDNIEITTEEREAIAARLRARRLEKRRNTISGGSERGVEGKSARVGGLNRYRFTQDSSAGTSGRSGGYRTQRDESSYFGWGEESNSNNSWESNSDYFSELGGSGGETSSTASFSDEYQDTTKVVNPPDIVILSPDELDRVLPILPFAAQANFFTGGAAQAIQRWAASLALTLLFSKAALLAATSLTWPLWWPWARAANKNYGIRSKIEYGGIWRTTVLSIEKGNRPRPQFKGGGMDDDDDSIPRFNAMRSCRILVGEEDGAQIELILPHDARFDLLQSGQPAEVVVLSNSTSFDDIKAVRDVYLPESALWLSEYPYIDRSEFLEISLEIEREN